MTRCTFKQGNYNCGSYAFNLYKEDIDQGSYCDRHYWQAKALAQPELCKYGQEPKSCTSSPMDCQCAIDAALAQPEHIPDARKMVTEQEPVAWEQFYPDIGKPQIEQPKVRTGDCLLVGVCASEGHKIQAKQEPVKYSDYEPDGVHHNKPPQRTWVGLTDEEIDDLWESTASYYNTHDFARAIEAKLKEKNTHD